MKADSGLNSNSRAGREQLPRLQHRAFAQAPKVAEQESDPRQSGYPGGSGSKEFACNVRPRCGPWVGKISWRREWLPTPVFWPVQFHGQKSLAGYSSWGHRDVDTTQRRTLSFSARVWSLHPPEQSVRTRGDCRNTRGADLPDSWKGRSNGCRIPPQAAQSGWLTFLSCQVVNTSGSVDAPVSIATALQRKSSGRQYRNEWAWLFANNCF